MLTPQRRLARKVAARWGYQKALGSWQPKFPQELLGLKTAFRAEDSPLLADAQTSVNALLPKLLSEISRTQGDRYFMSSSEHGGKIFYYFAPKQPVDAFNLTLYIKRDMAHISFGYTPHKLNGMLDFHNMKSESTFIEPDLAGMAALRVARKLLSKL